MHLVGIAQSFGLFLMVLLAIGGVLSLAVAALGRLEAATVPVRHSDPSPFDRALPIARRGGSHLPRP